MVVYYDKSNDKLVYSGETTSSEFWDQYWETGNFRRAVERTKESRACTGIIKVIRLVKYWRGVVGGVN